MKWQNEKSNYRAWYEYLRESKQYQDVCNLISKGKHASKKDFHLSLSYDFFGDVFKTPFKQWWQSKQDPFSAIGTIEYSKQQAAHEFDAAAESLRTSLQREPALSELKEKLMEYMFDHLPGCLTVRVFFHPGKDTEYYKDGFSKLIREKRKLSESWEYGLSRSWLPIGERIRPKEMLRYLIVKRLDDRGLSFEDISAIIGMNQNEIEEYLLGTKRQKKSGAHFKEKDIAEIIDILNLQSDCSYGKPRRKDIEYAARILKNIETGIFPGNYYDSKSPGKKKAKRKA